MSGEHANPLAQLADIHGAAEPGLWPPAPGWWVLGLILFLLLAWLLRVAAAKITVRRRRQALLATVEALRGEIDPAGNPHGYISTLNRLFRAVALRAFPDTACGRLEGEAWVAFISGLMPEAQDTEQLAVLARGPYEPSPEFDVDALEELAAVWVKRYG